MERVSAVFYAIIKELVAGLAAPYTSLKGCDSGGGLDRIDTYCECKEGDICISRIHEVHYCNSSLSRTIRRSQPSRQLPRRQTKKPKKNRDILPGQHSRTAFLRIDEVYNFKVQTKVGFVVGGIACVVWIVSEESQSAAS